jgi:flagellar hook-basal body complex protein FliE
MSGFEPIQGDLGRVRLLGERPAAAPAAPEPGADFAGALVDALAGVDEASRHADETAAAMYRGEAVELHDLMIAMNQSDVAFNLMLEVRNKLVEAWQTLSRSVV